MIQSFEVVKYSNETKKNFIQCYGKERIKGKRLVVHFQLNMHSSGNLKYFFLHSIISFPKYVELNSESNIQTANYTTYF